MTYVPSGSEPATELFPLQLYPRLEMAETNEDMDSRFDSVAAVPASDRGCRKESGSSRGLTGALARLPRVLSSVGVASESSRAEPDQACPKYSKMLLSDALDGRRAGRLCRIAAAPSEGTDTLGRSTLRPPVSGSLDLAFWPPADAPLALESCRHDRVLSELAVRDSGCSMLLGTPCTRAPWGKWTVDVWRQYPHSVFVLWSAVEDESLYIRKCETLSRRGTSLSATWQHGRMPRS